MGRRVELLADRYEVVRELGAGGSSTVHLARDRKHDREVAIKVLRPELAVTVGAERFLREIRIAARLNHPNILPLYDSGSSDHLLYYVMPYIPGDGLRERLQKVGRLPLDEALKIARQVASALAYAHERGIVHRDVKPENVLLHLDEVRVADFGIARALKEAADETVTITGMVVGTPAYMSPEQASGAPDLDARSDLYSLGCMLHEMLTGSAPHDAPTPQAMLARRLVEPAPRLTRTRPDAPEWLADALTQALERTPTDRYQTAQEFLEALAGEPVATPRIRRRDRISSIAVLPFANMSADPENEYISDGLAEDIINALTKVEALEVAARTSSFAFKGKNVDIREIGERLGVGAVLEGSIRKFGTRLRITAQLVKVSDGFHLWSEQFDREMEDIFAIQDEIAEAAVRMSTAALVEEPTSKRRHSTMDLEAYSLYLKGRYHWNRRTNRSMLQAIELFQQALDRVPSYAPALAGIADCYTLLGWVAFGALAPSEAFPKAEAAALKAIEVEPSSAEAYNSLGWTRLVYAWDFTAAEEAFQTAIRLRPRYGMAHAWYALHLAWCGRFEEAFRESDLAQELDPLSLIIHTLVGWVYYFARVYDHSISQYRKTLELEPNYVRTYLGLGWAYEQKGLMEKAMAEFERGVQLSGGSPRYTSALGHAYARAGREEQARAVIRDLEELAGHQYVSPSYIAWIYAGLGAPDPAFEWLERSYEDRSGALVYLGVDPQMDGLRDDPRFADLVRRVGTPSP